MSSEINPSSFSFAAPDGLKINLLSHAFGIPRDAASFSWIMHSNDVSDIQTAYRILIARRLEDIADEDYLLDTGWTATDESSDVSIAGLNTLLEDNELYYWAVQLRNKNGAESALSEWMPFSTAVGTAWEDTHGIWSVDGDGSSDFSFLRTEFSLPDAEDVERVLLSVTACSPESTRQFVYRLFVNGTFVGVGPARIGKSEHGEDLLYYQTYDITSVFLADGINVLSAINYTTSEKCFLCQATAFYKNGTQRVLLNSGRDAEQFLGLDGTPVFASGHSLGTAHYSVEAENINATAFPFGFDRVGFDASHWQPVGVRDDLEIEGERLLAPYPGEPVEAFVHEVAALQDCGDGRYLIDLGQEIVGGLRLRVTASEEHTITVLFGEELNEDGSPRYEMRTGNVYREQWTLREGEQTLENIGMKTFRYVELRDCRAALSENDVHGIALRRRFDAEQSGFDCSNEVLCGLYDTYKYAICATNQDLYVDSQSRERCPYEGDTLINMLASYTYENSMALARFTADYLLSHRTWPAEYALLIAHIVHLDYFHTGNRALLDSSYAALRKLVLADKVTEDIGLYAAKAPANNTHDYIMVDWPACARDGYEIEAAHYNTVYNAIWYTVLRDMATLSRFVGKDDDTTLFRTMADDLRHAMIDRLYCPEIGAFRDGLTVEGDPIEHFAQHATAYALCMGIYTDAQAKDAMGRRLIGQDSIQMSIYGAFFLFEALYRAGFGAYATALLASDDISAGAHTFAASLRSTQGGVTLSPEAWNAEEKPNMSYSHPWGASPAALIVRGMFGIRPTRPGFRAFDIRPQIGDLPYASIRVPTVKGVIGVTLAQNREAFEAEVTIPANTTATVWLPVLPGGTNALFVNNQISNFPIENGCYHIELGSGTHRLLAQ